MPSAKKPSSEKKPRATPNSNPYGLTTREVEIMTHAWKCLDDLGKIDKKQLAKLADIPLADSAGRAFRKIKEKIMSASAEAPAAPGAPGTPTNGNGIDSATVDAALGDPDSPSVLASEKKNSKKKTGSAKTAGRKRVLNEADDAHTGGGDEGVKNESDGEERPKKIPRLALGQPIVTVKTIEAAQGLGSDEVEAGEV